jgi:hypothetical protein
VAAVTLQLSTTNEERNMKKLGMTLMLAALFAIAAVATAAAGNSSERGSSVSVGHAVAQGDDRGERDEPGEDIRGNCDEAEHAGDAACGGAAAAGSANALSGASTRPGASSTPVTVTARTKLVASVGPGFSITLRTGAGAAVKSLRAGTYEIVVHDRSPEHNFHLSGRAVNKSTSVGSTATSTWRVRFVSGAYTFQCDPHAEMMRGRVRVA